MSIQLKAAAFVVLFFATAPGSLGDATFRDCADCPQMVSVPAGGFTMGSPVTLHPNRNAYTDDESPPHQVTVKSFLIANTEVTRAQFAAFVGATKYRSIGPCEVFDEAVPRDEDYASGDYVVSSTSDWRNPGFPQADDHPVVCVSWDDARAYTQWLRQKTGKDYRLPTEAEWEYAAKAGLGVSQYWKKNGADACKFGNFSDQTRSLVIDGGAERGSGFSLGGSEVTPPYVPCKDGYVYTAPVAHFKPNGFGLFDMLGNVLEWTEDVYHDSYDGAPTDGSAWLFGGTPEPNGARDNVLRVYRGGSWGYAAANARTAFRLGRPAGDKSSNVGFRVARSH